jgi:hypothetical protein
MKLLLVLSVIYRKKLLIFCNYLLKRYNINAIALYINKFRPKSTKNYF